VEHPPGHPRIATSYAITPTSVLRDQNFCMRAHQVKPCHEPPVFLKRHAYNDDERGLKNDAGYCGRVGVCISGSKGSSRPLSSFDHRSTRRAERRHGDTCGAAGTATPLAASLNSSSSAASASGALRGNSSATLRVTMLRLGLLRNNVSLANEATAQLSPGFTKIIAKGNSYSETIGATGSFTVAQTQNGNGHDLDWTATCGKLDQTINFTAPVDTTFVSGALVPLSASATSSLPVTLTSNSTTICTISGSNAVLLKAGVCSITASQAGNTTFDSATPVARSFTINKAPGHARHNASDR
jgi:hypothetical protein